jgi:hypothetical protein
MSPFYERRDGRATEDYRWPSVHAHLGLKIDHRVSLHGNILPLAEMHWRAQMLTGKCRGTALAMMIWWRCVTTFVKSGIGLGAVPDHG